MHVGVYLLALISVCVERTAFWLERNDTTTTVHIASKLHEHLDVGLRNGSQLSLDVFFVALLAGEFLKMLALFRKCNVYREAQYTAKLNLSI